MQCRAWKKGIDSSLSNAVFYPRKQRLCALILAALFLVYAVGSGGAAAQTAPTLTPGNGFSGGTPQPPAIGSGFGADAKAIARWDVVPFQTFSGQFEIGVMAFHIEGIDRVELSVDGGPWASVSEMSANPRTGVVEYWAVLDANRHDDGPMEIRAVVYPNVGIPRVLADPITGSLKGKHHLGEHSMFLNANSGGSLPQTARYVSPSGSDTTGNGSAGNPFRTIARAAQSIQSAQGGNADGGLVYLLAGNHVYGPETSATTEHRWLTITPAPGVTPANAPIVDENGDLGLTHVRLKNVVADPPSSMAFQGGTGLAYLWLDGVTLNGAGRSVQGPWTGFSGSWDGLWVTDSQVSNSKAGIEAFEALLLRNVVAQGILSDAFSNTGAVINCHAEDFDPLDSGAHPDVYQDFGHPGNQLIYGLTSDAGLHSQGFHSNDSTDLAIVESLFHLHPNSIGSAFNLGVAENVYILRSVFEYNNHIFHPGHNIVIEDSRFGRYPPWLPEDWDTEGVTIRNDGNTHDPMTGDVLGWEQIEVGTDKSPTILLADPQPAAVSFYLNGVFNRTDDTGPDDPGSGRFQMWPTVTLVEGDEIRAEWGDGQSHTVYAVGGSVPVITLVGESPVTVDVGETYNDAGATAYDAQDGNLTFQMDVDSNVDTSLPGAYTVTYRVTDFDGNDALPLTREVHVAGVLPEDFSVPYLYEEGDILEVTIPNLALPPIQWMKGSTPLTDDGRIQGATSDTLRIAPLLVSDTGNYSVAYDDGTKTEQALGPFPIKVVPKGALPAVGPALKVLMAIVLLALGAAVLRRTSLRI